MKRIIFIILGCINICLAHAQNFNGQYISEWQWDMNRNTNLINQLRLELSVPIGKGKDSFEAATLHVAKTNDGIIDDWQGFSNIDADNNFAMLAVHVAQHGMPCVRTFCSSLSVTVRPSFSHSFSRTLLLT